MRKFLVNMFMMLVIAVMCGCDKGGGDVVDPVPSVYYWRTVFNLDSTEASFLKEHGVKRIYMRYFDVVVRDSVVKPNATIKFNQAIPKDVEIVPTIFIVENCFKRDMRGVAKKLVNRVMQMNETNDVAGVREIQIDCDWTARSQQSYFGFLDEVRTLLEAKNMRLSVTIRLHQLSMTPPPADYGVLMMYNTGGLKDANGHNPILDYRDVYPYMKQLGKYKLPLCAAWPCYKWNLLYSGNQFKGILYDVNLADSTLYREVNPGHRVIISNRGLPEPNSDGSDMTWVNVGDSVITMLPTAGQILKIVEATEKERPGINKQVIIYSLDNKSIENYDKEFFKTIFSR